METMNTPTPRTDAMLESTWRTINVPDSPIPAEFARQLERELAAMTAERDALKNAPREIICARCGLREQQGILPPADF